MTCSACDRGVCSKVHVITVHQFDVLRAACSCGAWRSNLPNETREQVARNRERWERHVASAQAAEGVGEDAS